MRLRALYKRAALDLANQVSDLRNRLRDAEAAALDGSARVDRIEADLTAWRERAEKAERAEAELVERLARLAEDQTPGIVEPADQCRWVSLLTAERCGLRESHRGDCVDSAGRFTPGPWTAIRDMTGATS